MATQTKFRNRITSHLRRNVLAVAALFIVLGGTAVALPGKNSVDSGDIRNKTVKTKDIAKQAVTEKKLADNAVTGAKADEASFQGLVKGDGRQSDGRAIPSTRSASCRSRSSSPRCRRWASSS